MEARLHRGEPEWHTRLRMASMTQVATQGARCITQGSNNEKDAVVCGNWDLCHLCLTSLTYANVNRRASVGLETQVPFLHQFYFMSFLDMWCSHLYRSRHQGQYCLAHLTHSAATDACCTLQAGTQMPSRQHQRTAQICVNLILQAWSLSCNAGSECGIANEKAFSQLAQFPRQNDQTCVAMETGRKLHCNLVEKMLRCLSALLTTRIQRRSSPHGAQAHCGNYGCAGRCS